MTFILSYQSVAFHNRGLNGTLEQIAVWSCRERRVHCAMASDSTTASSTAPSAAGSDERSRSSRRSQLAARDWESQLGIPEPDPTVVVPGWLMDSIDAMLPSETREIRVKQLLSAVGSSLPRSRSFDARAAKKYVRFVSKVRRRMRRERARRMAASVISAPVAAPARNPEPRKPPDSKRGFLPSSAWARLGSEPHRGVKVHGWVMDAVDARVPREGLFETGPVVHAVKEALGSCTGFDERAVEKYASFVLLRRRSSDDRSVGSTPMSAGPLFHRASDSGSREEYRSWPANKPLEVETGGAGASTREPPAWPPREGATNPADALRYKTVVCRDYRRDGRCPRGDHCQWAHGISELRPPARRKETRTCRYWSQSGRCWSGAHCRFLHDTPGGEPRQPTVESSSPQQSKALQSRENTSRGEKDVVVPTSDPDKGSRDGNGTRHPSRLASEAAGAKALSTADEPARTKPTTPLADFKKTASSSSEQGSTPKKKTSNGNLQSRSTASDRGASAKSGDRPTAARKESSTSRTGNVNIGNASPWPSTTTGEVREGSRDDPVSGEREGFVPKKPRLSVTSNSALLSSTARSRRDAQSTRVESSSDSVSGIRRSGSEQSARSGSAAASMTSSSPAAGDSTRVPEQSTLGVSAKDNVSGTRGSGSALPVRSDGATTASPASTLPDAVDTVKKAARSPPRDVGSHTRRSGSDQSAQSGSAATVSTASSPLDEVDAVEEAQSSRVVASSDAVSGTRRSDGGQSTRTGRTAAPMAPPHPDAVDIVKNSNAGAVKRKRLEREPRFVNDSAGEVAGSGASSVSHKSGRPEMKLADVDSVPEEKDERGAKRSKPDDAVMDAGDDNKTMTPATSLSEATVPVGSTNDTERPKAPAASIAASTTVAEKHAPVRDHGPGSVDSRFSSQPASQRHDTAGGRHRGHDEDAQHSQRPPNHRLPPPQVMASPETILSAAQSRDIVAEDWDRSNFALQFRAAKLLVARACDDWSPAGEPTLCSVNAEDAHILYKYLARVGITTDGVAGVAARTLRKLSPRASSRIGDVQRFLKAATTGVMFIAQAVANGATFDTLLRHVFPSEPDDAKCAVRAAEDAILGPPPFPDRWLPECSRLLRTMAVGRLLSQRLLNAGVDWTHGKLDSEPDSLVSSSAKKLEERRADGDTGAAAEKTRTVESVRGPPLPSEATFPLYKLLRRVNFGDVSGPVPCEGWDAGHDALLVFGILRCGGDICAALYHTGLYRYDGAHKPSTAVNLLVAPAARRYTAIRRAVVARAASAAASVEGDDGVGTGVDMRSAVRVPAEADLGTAPTESRALGTAEGRDAPVDPHAQAATVSGSTNRGKAAPSKDLCESMALIHHLRQIIDGFSGEEIDEGAEVAAANSTFDTVVEGLMVNAYTAATGARGHSKHRRWEAYRDAARFMLELVEASVATIAPGTVDHHDAERNLQALRKAVACLL